MEFSLKARLLQIAIIFFFVFFLLWWTISHFVFGISSGDSIWGNSYQLVALLGAIGGFIVSQNFLYGIQSLVSLRRSITFFSLGLLFQVFGQSIFGIYISVFNTAVPYPSLADIGFFGSVLCYLYALILLCRITGIKVTIKSFKEKLVAVFIPIILLLISYFVFSKGYVFDWNYPMRVFLDFGYPLFQAIYVSLALIILLFSKNLVSGIIKWPPLLLAMLVQYLADFNFLYQAKNGTWVNSNYGDILYLCAYFILALALIKLGVVFQKLIDKNGDYVKSLLAE
jgi:hypothetical protein